MIERPLLPLKFSKKQRLLKRKDFSFKPYTKIETQFFNCYVQKSDQISASQLGISLPKKTLKLSVARNKIRRLLKETYRLKSASANFKKLHIVSKSTITSVWREQNLESISNEINFLFNKNS
jgi:ribonuclease P protein component